MVLSRRLVCPGNGHDWTKAMVSHPPVMTSVVHCVPCSASFFFSFPQFWQTVHHRWPSSGGFVQTQQNKVGRWPCVSGMEQCGKLTSICHSILSEIPGVRMTEKPGCGDLSKRSSYSNMGNFLEGQERADCANGGLSIPDAWPLDIRRSGWLPISEVGTASLTGCARCHLLGAAMGWCGQGVSPQVVRDHYRQKWGRQPGREGRRVASRNWKPF